MVVLFSIASTSSSLTFDKKPSLNEIHRLLADTSVHWDDIGRRLEVPLNMREGWRTDNSLSNDACLERVMNHWLESECHKPVTWVELIEVLKSIHLVALSEKVEKYLGSVDKQ